MEHCGDWDTERGRARGSGGKGGRGDGVEGDMRGVGEKGSPVAEACLLSLAISGARAWMELSMGMAGSWGGHGGREGRGSK